jgi:hypothetical protein
MVVRRELRENSSVYARWRTSTNPTIPIGADNYLGRFHAWKENISDVDFAVIAQTPSVTLNAFGTTAIARVIPTNPLAGLTTALGELRSEGLPLIPGVRTWRDKVLRARNAGDEYLNAEFGWLPLIRDIQTFASVVRRSGEIVAKYERESGKLLHRRFTFPTQLSSTGPTLTNDWPKPAAFSNIWVSQGVRSLTTITQDEVWFSGAFTYYLPPQGSVARDVAIADKLLGARITPEVVWNLTPWSWAIDWFSNAGDVIHNVSRFMSDGLVMPYGYVMRKRTTSKEYTHTGAVAKQIGFNANVGTLTQTLTTTVKERSKATPFGFGQSFGSFTNRQKAILAALGLTRGSTGMKFG